MMLGESGNDWSKMDGTAMSDKPNGEHHPMLEYIEPNGSKRSSIMFEPIEGDEKNVRIWEKVPKRAGWSLIAIQDKTYARLSWNWHVEKGAVRTQ